MANAFSKEERVAFEQMLDKFDDQLVMSSVVSKYRTNAQQMERSSDTIWRPMPYIATAVMGTTATFVDNTQLSVPAKIDKQYHSTALMSATEMRDILQEERFGMAAAQKLGSVVNEAVLGEVIDKATLVVRKTTAATGYTDVADIDSLMNEQGIMMDNRYLALTSGAYNAMAANLAGRQTMTGMPTDAYRRSYVGQVAGFETFKMDYGKNLLATNNPDHTVNGATQRHIPAATDTNGQNVDNRTMTLALTVGSTGGATRLLKAGDIITIAGVNAVHHITKQSTGELKHFRVIEAPADQTAQADINITISPPIVDGTHASATQAEEQYANVSGTPADNAVISRVNTNASRPNPFWHKDAIELLPGTLAFDSNAGAAILRGTTGQGMELTMQKQFDITSQNTRYRWDIRFGVNVTQPEMCGLLLFDVA